MARIGRPKIYQNREIVQLLIERDMLEFLTQVAQDRDISRNELIRSILAQADIDLATNLAQELKGLREAISHLDKNNKELMTKLKNFSRRSINGLYMDITPDENIRKGFEVIKQRFRNALIQNNGVLTPSQINVWAEMILNETEQILLKEGKAIKNRSVAKLMAKKLLVNESGI